MKTMATQGLLQGNEREFAIRPVQYTPTDTSRLGWQYRTFLNGLPTKKPVLPVPLNYYGVHTKKLPPAGEDRIWQPAAMYGVYRWLGPPQPAPGIPKKYNVNL